MNKYFVVVLLCCSLLCCSCVTSFTVVSPHLRDRVKPKDSIAIHIDYVVWRWQEDGPVISVADSIQQGQEYLDAISDELSNKGYRPYKGDVVDINWMLEDGKSMPVIRDSEFDVKRSLLMGDYLQYDASIKSEKETVPIKISSTSSSQTSGNHVLSLVRKIDKLFGFSDDAKKRTIEEELPEVKRLDKASYSNYVLLVWGSTVASSKKQQFKNTNWGELILTAAISAGATGGKYIFGQTHYPANKTEMKAALIDTYTGRILWCNMRCVDEQKRDERSSQLKRKQKFARSFLSRIPKFKNDMSKEPRTGH